MSNILLAVFILFSVIVLPAQTQDSYAYNSEFTWGINKNSFGGLIGGFTFKSARRINKNMFETFGLEIMNVKNPHEVRLQSSSSGNYFLFGKTHYLYALRTQYGRDIILFTKGPQQGVEVKAVFAAGPTIGIVAPYYVQISDPSSPYYNTVNVPYTGPNDQPFNNIQGSGSLFQGIGNSNIQLGGNFKVALNFELGASKNQVSGFEAGFLLDAYFKKVNLMYSDPSTPVENYSLYPTVFITLFYGSRR
ncbi:MAG: hypothetical protein JST48_02690 [Bacteroidetes bacterium]|nr:hypothetical protein [Bacteroidota bacterium]